MQQPMASNFTSTDPPQPPTATTTVTTTTTKPSTAVPPPPRPTKNPQFHHRHLPFQHPPIQPGPFQAQPHLGKPPPDPIRYPLASSGRGLLPSPRLFHHLHSQLPLPEQVQAQAQVQVQVPNSGTYPQLPASTSQHTFLHPSSLPHYSRPSSSPTPPVRGISPLSKAATSPYTAPENNIPKDSIDKGTDDTLVTLRDRKVRISDGASLYALCRSWLRNGYLEENQPQYGDVLKSLSKPLPQPQPLPESSPLKRKERDDETEVDEAEKVETLTAEELLSRHVKRAKKVRARLREERLQRIERYKSRLALLLPPLLQE